MYVDDQPQFWRPATDAVAVADPTEWPTVGPLLLDAVRTWGFERGATQLIVVVAHLDQPKRSFLRTAQLDIASEWWVAPITRW